MRASKIFCVALGALFFVACGSEESKSTCDKLISAIEHASSAAHDCPGELTGELELPSSISGQCAPVLDLCSDADRDHLSDYAACLAGVQSCSEASYSDWKNTVEQCEGPLEAISSTCIIGNLFD